MAMKNQSVVCRSLHTEHLKTEGAKQAPRVPGLVAISEVAQVVQQKLTARLARFSIMNIAALMSRLGSAARFRAVLSHRHAQPHLQLARPCAQLKDIQAVIGSLPFHHHLAHQVAVSASHRRFHK